MEGTNKNNASANVDNIEFITTICEKDKEQLNRIESMLIYIMKDRKLGQIIMEDDKPVQVYVTLYDRYLKEVQNESKSESKA